MASLDRETALALHDFGLITLDQAEEAITNFEREWREVYESAEWWIGLARIAWENETPWYKRFLWAGVPPADWTYAWISERS